MDPKNERMMNWLKAKITNAENALKKFSKDVAENPVHAMEWADDAYTNAARQQAYTGLLRAMQQVEGLKNDKAYDIKAIESYCSDQVLYYGRNPSRSTSQSTNLMHRAMLTAYAEATEEAKYV